MRPLGRKAAIVVLAAALMTPPLSPAGAAKQSCAAMFETVQLKTFHVVISTAKKVYRVGETVPIDIEVTRPAHEDPLGQDQPMDPPASEPASDVTVGLGLQVGRTYLFGIGRTDDAG
ncbi:MAG: hypothetical protein ABR505_10510, partial [Actinomycetota bacterium]